MVSTTISIVLNKTRLALKAAGIENYANEALWLVEKATGLKRNEIILKGANQLSDNENNKLDEYISRRLDGEPLQYIIGEWEFFGLAFKVGKGVLIPRQDTEALVEAVLDYIKDKYNPEIIDLCSGSGCIAIALDKNIANAKIHAVELSDDAIFYLNQNIVSNDSDVTLFKGNVLDMATAGLYKNIDLIVSNPPYLNENDMNQLQREVSFEPEMALFAEDNGVYFYKEITRLWKICLKKGGMIAFECGINQHNDIKLILEDNGFENICFKEDLCGIIRVVSGIRK